MCRWDEKFNILRKIRHKNCKENGYSDYRVEVQCKRCNTKFFIGRKTYKHSVNPKCKTCDIFSWNKFFKEHYKLTYSSYQAMLGRCVRKGHKQHEKYKSLVEPVCKDWLQPNPEGFLNFLEDMGERPSEEYSLDRVDNYKGYSKENCRWATDKTQLFNIRKKENNTSGKTGVYFNKNMNKWLAYIRLDGKSKHLGYFVDIEDAIKARVNAEIEVYGFTKE